jgi:hypothetical protein
VQDETLGHVATRMKRTGGATGYRCLSKRCLGKAALRISRGSRWGDGGE